MSLINAGLAVGAALFVVPLVIHLLHRNRFRRVDWGAMHLIEPVVRTNRRRIRWMHWLLLLLRCAIPILLAICLARPMVNGWSAGGMQSETLVIVIDDSLSMARAQPGQESSLAKAKRVAKDFLRDSRRGDSIAIVSTSQRQRKAGFGGRREALEVLDVLVAQGGPVQIDDMLRAGLETLAASDGGPASIILVSDFARPIVDTVDPASLGELAAQVSQRDGLRLIAMNVGAAAVGDESTTNESIRDVSLGDDLPNVLVKEIRLTSPAVVQGGRFEIAATIENRSDVPARDVRVVGQIDATEVDSRTLTIPPQAAVVVRMNSKAPAAGVRCASVEAIYPDALAGDNRRTLAVDVIDSVPVWVIDGKPSRESMGGQADFLSIALSPFAMSGIDKRDAIRTRTFKRRVPWNDLTDAKKRPDVMIFCGPVDLPPGELLKLNQYLGSGGSLVLFDSVDVNSKTRIEKIGKMLPAIPGDWQSFDDPRNAETEISGAYAPWQSIGDAEGKWTLPLKGYRKLRAQPDTRVLWRRTAGDSLALSRQVGQGRVIQFAISATDQDSQWPLQPAFLAMVQQLVLDLAGDGRNLNVDVGQTLEIDVDRWLNQCDGPAKDSAVDRSGWVYEWVDPNGKRFLVKPDAMGRVAHVADVPGIYRLQVFDGENSGASSRFNSSSRSGATNSAAGAIASTRRVAMVPAIESDLRLVATESLAEILEPVGVRVYADSQRATDSRNLARNGRELWPYFLWGLLAVMIGELFWQQKITTPPRSGGALPSAETSSVSPMATTGATS
ncbi:MAG: BatA domain-containing protein [Planctomycetota bacterium]